MGSGPAAADHPSPTGGRRAGHRTSHLHLRGRSHLFHQQRDPRRQRDPAARELSGSAVARGRPGLTRGERGTSRGAAGRPVCAPCVRLGRRRFLGSPRGGGEALERPAQAWRRAPTRPSSDCVSAFRAPTADRLQGRRRHPEAALGAPSPSARKRSGAAGLSRAPVASGCFRDATRSAQHHSVIVMFRSDAAEG